MMPEGDKLKISWDDLKKPQVDAELKRQSQAQPQGTAPALSPGEKAYPPPRQYGSITPMPTQTAGGGLLYSAVFYTAVAGLLGALLAWIISELIVQHALTQDASISPGLKAAVFFATVGAILGLALCAVEGIISRNYSAVAISGIIGLVLGMIGGGLAGGFGQALYELGAKEKQSVILTLDISGSMDGGPLTDLKSSSRRFINSADPKTVAIGVVTFSDEANVISPPTENAAMLASAVDDLKASGETNMVGGLKQAHSLLEGKSGRRAVLLFTDGKPNKYEGMQDLQTLLDAEMKRQNLTVETLVSRELAKKDLQLSDLASLSEEKRRDYIQGVLIQFCDDSGILKQIEGAAEAATEAEAKKMRDAGIEIIAIGTGDAERGFLARLAGSNEKVLFAAYADIPSAFTQAQKLLFKESASTAKLSAASVGIRTLCWAFVGTLIALGQGVATRSGKKARNAALGGLIGGLIGGLLFDPLSIALQSGWASRLVAIGIIGMSTGVMIGLVENILKDAWLQVVSGPLTGKQFVIYRNPTTIGSSPKCDIYLFKDPAIEPQHMAITNDGHSYLVQDTGGPAGTLVNGRRVVGQRLKSGDRIQVGGTTFLYSEKIARPAGIVTA